MGDRYVFEEIERAGLSLGGEQSGHLIFRDIVTTGDGLLSSLIVADVMRRSERTLAELAGEAMQRIPQVLRNVRLSRRPSDLNERIAPAIDAAQAELGDAGRVLIRPSGTEPLVRVMVEAPTSEAADRIAGDLCRAIEAAAD